MQFVHANGVLLDLLGNTQTLITWVKGFHELACKIFFVLILGHRCAMWKFPD